MNSRFYFLLFTFSFVLLLSIFYFLDSNSEKNINQASVSDVSIDGEMVLGEGFIKYVHPEIGFSFEYQEDLKVEIFKESNGGETIVFQKRGDTSDMLREQKTGFQIFVVPFEDDGSRLTYERIKREIPGVAIEESLKVIIGEKAGRSVEAILFWSKDGRIGRTREIWFVDKGYLFEVTTYEHLDSWLAQIMSTWSFSRI